jgi:hypothetical protein
VLRDASAAIVVSDREACDSAAALSTSDWGYVRMRREEYADADLENLRARLYETGWDEADVFFKHEDGRVGPGLACGFRRCSRSSVG